ncbi:unnamed protein product [Alopecurus aequalis]
MTWFPKLRVLKIIDCPNVSSLPPIPWSPASCSVEIKGAGCGFKKLSYSRNYKKELSLEIEGEGGLNDVFWNGLDFHNLADLKELEIKNCPPLPLIHLQKLKSLKTLKITNMSIVLLFEGEIHSTGCALPVERIEIEKCGANGEELTELLSHFPKLTCLWIERCGKITGLAAQGHQTTMAMAIPASPTSSSDNISQHAQAGHYQRLTRRDDEVASAEQGLLLLPSQLQDFSIRHCDELCLLSNSLGNGNARDGLQSLNSLRILRITDCPKFLSSYSSSASSCFAFPTSLQSLLLGGIETLDCLSNLVSLHTLHLWNCPDLRGEGLWPLVAQGCLTRLLISRTPKFFTGWKLSSYSSKLEYLMTNGHVGVLTLPICSLLSSSLTKLTLYEGRGMERFTEEQEDALHLLNSLQELEFCSCEKLQRIPAGLTKLTNLKRLRVQGCPAIRSLPKDGLPSSLQELVICDCPAIKSLPKDGLPSSLLKLQVYGISEELKRQCHKLKGTIPIVADYEAKAF